MREKISIDEVFSKHNLKVDEFVMALKAGLSATKTVKDRYGDIVSEEPDHSTRHKFFASGMELLGYLKAAGVNVQVVNVSKEEKELLEAYQRGGVANG